MMMAYQGKIGMLGAGALGGFYGARLFQAGHDVHFLMRRDYEMVRANGLRVYSPQGDFLIQPPVHPTPEAIGRCDLLIVGLKSTDNDSLMHLLAATAGEQTLVLTLQNGLGNEERIVRTLTELGQADAAERVLGGVAFLCSDRPEPGVVRHTAHGWIRLAEFGEPVRERTRTIAKLFAGSGIDCKVHDSLRQIRWEKLVWNIPFNGMGVAGHHADTAAILADPELQEIARGLMSEVLAAARGDGVVIEATFPEQMIHATLCMEAYRSSMQLDYEQGRPLEVEAILGEPLRRARQAGIETPRLQMLYGIVSRMAGERGS